MPEPNIAIKNRRPYWLIPGANGKTQVAYSPPRPAGVDIPIASGRLGGMGENIFGAQPAPPHGEEVTYENGEVWDEPADGREPAPINAAAVQGNRLRIAQESRTPPEETTGAWTIQKRYDGSTWRINKVTGEEEQLSEGEQQGKYVTDSNGNVVWIPAPTLDPGQAGPERPPSVVYQDPNADLKRQQAEAALAETRRRTAQIGVQAPRQPRYPDEEEHARLQNEKLRRELQDPFTLRTQQHAEAIKAIEAMLNSGQLGTGAEAYAKANKLIALARENMNAALQGTTPFQMQTQRQDLARGVLGDQQQTAGSLATGLLSGLGGIYGKVYSSTRPPAIDPFDLVGPFMQQYGGGPEMGGLAKSILMGAFQQGGL